MAADPLHIALRCLPALLVFVLAFVASADRKTREHWGQLMYQIGSIRADQRSDPKVQRGVRWPFFLVAVLLLLWPIQYYRRASQVLIPVAPESTLAPTEMTDPQAGASPMTTPYSTAVAPAPPAPASSAPQPVPFNP